MTCWSGVYDGDLTPKLFAFHLGVALVCLGWLLQTRGGRDVRLTPSPALLPLGCGMGIALLSAAGATHPLDTAAELLNQAVLFALFVIVTSALSPEQAGPVLWASAATGLAVALIGILQYHGLAFLDLPATAPPAATFVNRNVAAMYLVCAAPLAGMHFLTARDPRAVLLSGSSATLMAVYLVYTRTRGAWVGGIGALLLVAGLLAASPGIRRPVMEALRPQMDPSRKRWAVGFAALFLLLSALPPARSSAIRGQGVPTLPESKSAVLPAAKSIFLRDRVVSYDQSREGRLAIWGVTLRLIADHPFLGVGPGGWKYAYPPYDQGTTITPDASFQNPHNDYLWIAAEFGLIGLGIYVYLLGTAFRGLLRMARSREPAHRIAGLMFALSLLATLGDACFSFPRARPHAAMFFYLLLSLIAVTARDEKERRQKPGRSLSAFRLLPALLLVVCLAAVVLSWKRIGFDRHYLMALYRAEREDWPGVLSEAERAMGYGLFRPHALILRGAALANLNDPSGAEAAYLQALVYAPYTWQAHAGLCALTVRQGRFEEALVHGRAVLSILPTYAEGRVNLGIALAAGGDLDGAMGEYRRAIALAPGLAEAHYNLGTALLLRKDTDGAIGEYREAIRIDPGHVSAHYNLGVVLAARGNPDGAMREYREALRIDPGHASAHYQMGEIMAARGDAEGAIQEFRVCLRLTNNERLRQRAEARIRELGGTP